jgi:2-amino-4-hydroxy-6-hydroxymethyldihydropteridine diphosphokinase
VIGYLGLGSNVGDRRAHLQAAVAALAAHPEIEVLTSSSVYDTEPQGAIRDQPSFLNAAVRIETTLDPNALLQAAKNAEQTVGRTPGPRHGPREVDVDLLLLGDTQLATDRLTLPHRETSSRRFVLVPLLELDPGLHIPGRGSARDALATLKGQAVRLAGPPLVL